MGHKVVCLDCRKSFSQGTDFEDRKDAVCPYCGQQMILLPHRFRPPKKTDLKKWETVKYLVENGFCFQHIYETIEKKEHYNWTEKYVEYPENLKDAKEFVEKYKSQAIR